VEIILGSGSPRRRIILEGIFGAVRIISPSVDESLFKDEPAYDYTGRITNLKMDAVLSGLNPSESGCIITSDTIVSIDDKILGKPVSEDEAVSMLRMLSNREHSVITGVSLVLKNGYVHERFYGCETTSVKFKMLSDDTIRNYLRKVNYSDKAGSYAIQESGEMLVDSITGSMTNVIGFPLRLFFRMINNSGMSDPVLK
jgi:septum formation protein